MCLVRVVVVGFVIIGGFGYMVLYSKKKLEVLVGDVVKVMLGVFGIIESICFCN